MIKGRLWGYRRYGAYHCCDDTDVRDQGVFHWYWRYQVTMNGLMMRDRRAFRSWGEAFSSLQRSMALLADAVGDDGETVGRRMHWQRNPEKAGRCEAVTAQGTRCRNDAGWSGSPLCWMHSRAQR